MSKTKYKIEITREEGWLLRYWASLSVWQKNGYWWHEIGGFGFTEERAKENVIKEYKDKLEKEKNKTVINLDEL